MLSQLKRNILLLGVVLMVSACATQSSNVHRIVLANNVSYVLQPIPKNLLNTGMLASFNVKQQGQDNTFLMQVEMTQSHLLIAGMTVEGLSLFNLDWNIAQSTLNYDKKIAIEPRRILAELQLVLWPTADISQGLQQAELTIISANEKEISSVAGIIYRINQQANISQLRNLKQNYSIVIKELERWDLSVDNRASKENEK